MKKFSCSKYEIQTTFKQCELLCADYDKGRCSIFQACFSKVQQAKDRQEKVNEQFLDSEYSLILPSNRTAQRAELGNRAKLWAHRLREAIKENEEITLTSDNACEIVTLLDSIPRLVEAEAMSEIGLKQAAKVDSALSAFQLRKGGSGLKAAARILGWTISGRQRKMSNELLVYEYISLLEKHGRTTDAKVKAIKELQEKYGLRSFEATMKRIQRAATKMRKEGRGDTSDLDKILPSSSTTVTEN